MACNSNTNTLNEHAWPLHEKCISEHVVNRCVLLYTAKKTCLGVYSKWLSGIVLYFRLLRYCHLQVDCPEEIGAGGVGTCMYNYCLC